MSDRIRKVNELIRGLVAESISENISHDHIVTVKAVETSRDMKHSIVWVSAINNEAGFLEELEDKKREIRRDVTSKMASKYTPLIEFKIDHSGEYVQRIDELLHGKEPSES